MKLIDLLVQELPKRGGWPGSVYKIVQDFDGEVKGVNKEEKLSFNGGVWSRIGQAGNDMRSFNADLCIDYDSSSIEICQYEAALAASKSQWDGNGLPPVGCECEVKVGGDYFNLCRVVYSDKSCGVAFIYLGGDDEKYCGQIDCVSAKASSDYFRPIRSEADKKRDAAIAAIDLELLLVRNSSKTAEAIYDAISAGKIPGVKLED